MTTVLYEKGEEAPAALPLASTVVPGPCHYSKHVNLLTRNRHRKQSQTGQENFKSRIHTTYYGSANNVSVILLRK